MASWVGGCGKSRGREEPPPVPPPPVAGTQPAAGVPAEPAADVSVSRPLRPDEEARLPVDYPVVDAKAGAGDAVLAPPRAWIDEALERGVEHQVFVFFGGTMMLPGKNASRIRTLRGGSAFVPNALVIPIRPRQSARPGDVVLTWWRLAGSLQRALVVEGGDPASPEVRYLDVPFDDPGDERRLMAKLDEGTFHVLSKAGEPGTTVACRDEKGRYLRSLVVNVAGSRLLTVGFAGRLGVRDGRRCVRLEPRPRVKGGDEVYVPVRGVYRPGTVGAVDADWGRVAVSTGGEEGNASTVSVGFPDVATGLQRVP